MSDDRAVPDPRIRLGLRLVVFCVALACVLPAVAQDLQIIDLRYRRADEILPVLQPLVAPGGVISGVDNKLLVRTTAANFSQIQQAVASLDQPRRQLLITVTQETSSAKDAAGARGSVTFESGNVQAGVNRPPTGGTGATVVASTRKQQQGQQNTSSVRTMDGAETYIAIGQSVPVTSTQVTTGWYPPVVQQSTSYRDVTTGFYVTPRVSGDLVTLEISPTQQRYEASNGTIGTSGTNSVVSGRLGEWLQIGGVRQSDSGSTRGLLVWGRHTGTSEYTAWVKVEEVR